MVNIVPLPTDHPRARQRRTQNPALRRNRFRIRVMIIPQNEQEFKSLGIETVRRRAAAGVWDEAKSREAREWISNEETRIARSGKNAAWTAATAAIISAIMATISAVLAVLLFHR